MDETLETYIQTVSDKNNEISERICGLLQMATLYDVRSVDFFLACLEDESYEIRSYAINGIAVLAEQKISLPTDIEAILSNIISRDELAVQLSVIYALGAINTEKSLNIVLSMLKNQEPEIREASAKALYYVASPTTVQPLITLLTDENILVQVAAISALVKIASNEAVEPLLLLLSSDKDRVRKEAVIALGKLADVRAIKPLITLLQTETSGQVQIAIVNALGVFADRRTIFPLINCLINKNKFVRSSARHALIKLVKACFIKKPKSELSK